MIYLVLILLILINSYILCIMKIETARDWQSILRIIDDIERVHTRAREHHGSKVSDLLFRGQTNSDWKLESTLERQVSNPVSLMNYYSLIHSIKNRIETYTDNNWQVPSVQEYEKWLSDEEVTFKFNEKTYKYFAYLRHYGFPSPLLDWTTSCYIAMYFAMDNVPEDAQEVSLYILWELTGAKKKFTKDVPRIKGVEPNVNIDPRHFNQHSQYTICNYYHNDEIIYGSHQEVADLAKTNEDRFWKINIPVEQRITFLKELKKMKIDAYSLFGTEDKLIETITMNAFLLNNDNILIKEE